jgi:hypothetical protein
VVMTIEDAEEIAWMLKRENILWIIANHLAENLCSLNFTT